MPALLTRGQQTFAARLSADTGLNPRVIESWELAEESGGAASSREASGNNNWLNIGYFDSGPGAITRNAAFRSPLAAADRTAQFLSGTFGGASSGIRGILRTSGQGPAQQIAAIAGSGWASSGYNHGDTLRQLYGQVGGQQLPNVGAGGSSSSGGGGGILDLSGFGGDATKGLLWVVFVLGGAMLVWAGAARAVGVGGPVATAKKAGRAAAMAAAV